MNMRSNPSGSCPWSSAQALMAEKGEEVSTPPKSNNTASMCRFGRRSSANAASNVKLSVVGESGEGAAMKDNGRRFARHFGLSALDNPLTKLGCGSDNLGQSVVKNEGCFFREKFMCSWKVVFGHQIADR
jgi:hypothetical protein